MRVSGCNGNLNGRAGPDGRSPVTVGIRALRRRGVVGPPRGQHRRLEAGLRAQLGRGLRTLVHRGRPLRRGRRRALLVPLIRGGTATQREYCVFIQHAFAYTRATLSSPIPQPVQSFMIHAVRDSVDHPSPDPEVNAILRIFNHLIYQWFQCSNIVELISGFCDAFLK